MTLRLPTVTLCAATSVNLSATIAALRACLDQVQFAECLLFTDKAVETAYPGIRRVACAPLGSSRDYSNFILQGLADHVRTSHCLIVQWDGFILDASRWHEDFLDFDYVGAPWPQFDDGHDVGNGGFSLRSRKLLDACRDPAFRRGHPEDVAICRDNRAFLEARHAIRFADRTTASKFAYERQAAASPTFGFHGVFNMPEALGAERFWELYQTLDDRRTALTDYRLLLRRMLRGRRPWRAIRLTLDRLTRARLSGATRR